MKGWQAATDAPPSPRGAQRRGDLVRCTNGIDAGAYAWMGAANPGWTVTAGFKDSAAPGPTLAFCAAPTSVNYQGQATLSWTSTNANTCTASAAWSGNKPLSGSKSTGTLDDDATYTLDCVGAGGNISRAVTVTVAAADDPPATDDLPTDLPEESSGSGAMRWWVILVLAEFSGWRRRIISRS